MNYGSGANVKCLLLIEFEDMVLMILCLSLVLSFVNFNAQRLMDMLSVSCG